MLTDMVSSRNQKGRSKKPSIQKSPRCYMHRGLFSEFSEPQSQSFTLQLHLASCHYLLGKMFIQMIDATGTQRIIHLG